jgi:hypothetical protein
MAGSIVQSQYNVDDSTSLSTTISVTLNGVTANNTLVVHVGWGDAALTCSVSDGSSYTSGAARVQTSSQSSQVFYLEAASGGTHNITATISGAGAPYRRIRAYEITGVATSSSLDQSTGQALASPGTGTDAVTSGNTSTTTNANDFLMGFAENVSETDPGSGTIAAGTNYTISGANQILAAESRNVSSTAAYAGTFTQDASGGRGYDVHVIAFKTAAGGGGGTAATLMGQACL